MTMRQEDLFDLTVKEHNNNSNNRISAIESRIYSHHTSRLHLLFCQALRLDQPERLRVIHYTLNIPTRFERVVPHQIRIFLVDAIRNHENLEHRRTVSSAATTATIAAIAAIIAIASTLGVTETAKSYTYNGTVQNTNYHHCDLHNHNLHNHSHDEAELLSKREQHAGAMEQRIEELEKRTS